MVGLDGLPETGSSLLCPLGAVRLLLRRRPLESLECHAMRVKDGIASYGGRELSPNIIRRLEDATGLDIRAPGFPAEMTDDEPEEPGYEVVPTGLHTTA